MDVKFIIPALNLTLFCATVYGLWQRENSCSSVKEINCLYPGLKPKVCLCSCLNATINREYLKIDFAPCVHILRNCSFYKAWFVITFTEKDSNFVTGKEETITVSDKTTSQIFPLFRLTNPYMPDDNYYNEDQYVKLKIDRQYIVSIQPKCTICDDCGYLNDLVLPAVIASPKELKQKSKDPASHSLSIIIVASIIVVISVLVATVFLLRSVSCAKRGDGNQTYNNGELQPEAETYTDSLSDSDFEYLDK